MSNIQIYDTTLRDGAQSEDLSLSASDKIKIALRIDELGIHYIEGGWPGSSPVDNAFFKEIPNYHLKHAKITAFGSTHHAANSPENDPTLKALIDSKMSVCTIFGKSSRIHALEALRIEPERNIEVIHNSVAYLLKNVEEVLFDAEHFFDGFKDNAEYALASISAAYKAGAHCLILCDTNGGCLPHEISQIVLEVKKHLPKAKLGIHTHNDCELAVANAIVAVRAGVSHVQGTINGFGERCGNTNLCSIIPILQLKNSPPLNCIPQDNLKNLTSTASYVAEVANTPLFNRQAFVGRSAFAHKGGVHVSAVNRNSSLYEHITPELVGNNQRILISELGGRSNIVSLARKFGFHLDKDEPVVKGLYAELNKRASLGYDYASAEASVELLLLKKLARRGVREFFHLIQYRVSEIRTDKDEAPLVEATVKVEVEGVEEHTAAIGRGPVNALDKALRKAISQFYPSIAELRLLDFKVRVISTENSPTGTDSMVRVLIESGDGKAKWVTVGVSHDVIEASWQALSDAVTYKLYRDEYIQRANIKP